MVRLKADPHDSQAQLQFERLLNEGDRYTMAEMRNNHNTRSFQMNLNYPSHRWIHPFLRGCVFARQGQEARAREEFAVTAIEAEKYLARWKESGLALTGQAQLAIVIASQARLHLGAKP